MDVPPEEGALMTSADVTSTGMSYENALRAVVTASAFRSAMFKPNLVPGELAQTMVVPVSHEVVAQAVLPNAAVPLRSSGSRLAPSIVMDWPPPTGPFSSPMREAMGASNESSPRSVLTSDATVRDTVGIAPDPRPLLTQLMEVYETQVTVAESRAPMTAVGDASQVPKFKPVTTSACPPDGGELYGMTLVTAATS
jgi:hypothetical protein